MFLEKHHFLLLYSLLSGSSLMFSVVVGAKNGVQLLSSAFAF